MSRPVVPTAAMRARASELADALEPVHVATTEAEREAIFRFRYEVYAAELGRKLGNADHTRRRLHDAEDDRPYTVLLYVPGEDGPAGTMRIRHWEPGAVPAKDREAFSMERFAGFERLRTAELGRLMVNADQRGRQGFVSLACAAFQLLAGELGTDAAFANCATGLVRYYRLIGLRTYNGRLVSTPDGIEVPLVVFPSDRAYMAQVGSLVTPFVDAFFGDGSGRRPPLDLAPFAELLDDAATPVQFDPAAVWNRVQGEVEAAAGREGLLESLSPDTVHKLSQKGFLVTIPAGELLTEKGLGQREMFVVLDGVFEVFDGDRRLRVLSRGDLIGEIAFFGTAGRRTASVRASSEGQVLVLRRRFIDELREKDPACAADILFHLGRVLADRAAAGIK